MYQRKISLIMLIVAFFVSTNMMWAQTPPATMQPTAASVPAPVTDQLSSIPYFTLKNGMSSVLTLNNNAPTSTPITVTIYNMKGKAQVLDPIVVPPHSFKKVELGDFVVSDEFNEGNLAIAFKGFPMEVGSQVTISNSEKRVSFESRDWGMMEMMEMMSRKFDGILSLPQENAEGFVAVTNLSANEVTVQASVGSKQKLVKLYSRQTSLLKLNDDFGLRGPTTALVRLQYSGMPGDIITTGFVMNLKDGYSSSFPMVDPSIMRSSHLSGVHVRIGKTGPDSGFPSDTTFSSPLLLANLGEKPVRARVSIDYTLAEKNRKENSSKPEVTVADKKSLSEGKFTTAEVKDLTIAPGAISSVELAEILKQLEPDDEITEAGVDVDYEAAPGTLIGHLVGVDQSGDYSFEVPIKDPAELGLLSNSAYPWNIEDGTNSVLHLKNTTSDSVRALLNFTFPDGSYYQPAEIILRPYQSISVDIKKLRESGTLDVLGRTFPAKATEGQLTWVERVPNTMIGRAEQINVQSGVESSFSCQLCCDNYSFGGIYLTPSSATGLAGRAQTFTGKQSYTNCAGTPFTNVQPVQAASSWGTTDPSVLTVSYGSYSGSASYVGGGNAVVSGTFPYTDYFALGCACHPTPESTKAQAAVAVQQPTATRTVSTVSNHQINAGVSPCPSGQGGWWRAIDVIVTDQNTQDIVQQNQYMTESYTISGSVNQLGMTSISTGDATTGANGQWGDDFWVCTTYCPGSSGQTDATQYPVDRPNGAGTSPAYNLATRSVVYQCNGITIDGY